MRLLLTILIVVVPWIAQSQVVQNDRVALSDSMHAITMNKQAQEEFNNNNLDKALSLAETSMQLSGTGINIRLDADNLLLIANIYRRKKSRDNALKFYIRAITAYEKLNAEPELLSVYRETGNYFFSLHAYAKALEYYQKAYSRAKGRDALKLLDNIGTCYYNLQDYAKSRDSFNQLLASLPPEALTHRLAALSQLANACNRLNEYNQSLSSNKEILSIYRQLKDPEGIAVALNNIAFDHVHLKNYPAAIDAFKESLTIAEQRKTDVKGQVDILINIGICYQDANDFDNALIHLRKAHKLTQANPQLLSVQAEIENIIAITYYYKGDYYNAELYSRNSISSARQCQNRDLLQSCYFTYSQILKAGNDFIKALEYYEMHLALKDSVEKEKTVFTQIRSQENLDLEKKEKELRLNIASDEIHDMELKRAKLEAVKREQELNLLRKQSALDSSEKVRILQSLKLTRQENEAALRNRELKSLEQEKALKDEQLKRKDLEKKEQEKAIKLLRLEKEKQSEARKRAIYTSILTGIIGLSVLIGLLVTRKKNVMLAKQKQEIEDKNNSLEQKNQEILAQTDQIVLQKKIIEEKNKAITDSIHYARRIQGAVLPPVDEIQQYFSDSFILFKPRDIVSGDFYWGIRKGDQVVIAAADCTGHGVPGAVMSMLGSAFLNEIAAISDLPDAAFILNELRKNIIKALRQKGEEGEAQDGMDIALCVINAGANTMHFAGANNPLYHIRNNELNIIKGDRMPIGIHSNSHIPFTNHKLKIEKDDSFYIFSDGMVDQFGGTENKKYKSSSLQQLLSNIHKNSFSVQHQLIEKEFMEWKGTNEQVDDVLLIGFKVRGG